MSANGFWSTAFIGLDGKDEKGQRAEVRVIKGFGKVAKITDSDAGNASQFTFEYDSKYNATGWAQKGTPIYDLLVKAKENDEPVYFRCENRRQKNVDRSLPYDEIAPSGDMAAARKNILKGVAGAKLEGDEDWTYGVLVTNPKEDPSGNGIYAASDEDMKTPSPAYDANAAARAESNFNEVAPWTSTLKDGSVNPGSVASGVLINFYKFLWQKEIDDNWKMTDKQRFVAVKYLFNAANEMQKAIWEDYDEAVRPKRLPDLGAGSHTRAREIVYETVRMFHPVPVASFTDDDKAAMTKWRKELAQWQENIVDQGLKMWRWSLKELTSLYEEE